MLILYFVIFITPQTSPPLEGGIIPSREVIEGDIEFRNIGFAYPSRPDIQIFKDLNLVCPSGKVTAIVGKSGTGKKNDGDVGCCPNGFTKREST